MQATASLQKMQDEVQTKSDGYFYFTENCSSESINKCKIIWDLILYYVMNSFTFKGHVKGKEVFSELSHMAKHSLMQIKICICFFDINVWQKYAK